LKQAAGKAQNSAKINTEQDERYSTLYHKYPRIKSTNTSAVTLVSQRNLKKPHYVCPNYGVEMRVMAIITGRGERKCSLDVRKTSEKTVYLSYCTDISCHNSMI